MAGAKHCVVTVRMVLVSVVVGMVLAVGSVPVGKIVSDRVLRTPNAQAWQGRFWLNEGDHQIFVYHRRDPFRAHWESSIVPAGMADAPGPEFERPASDPRPMYARRAFTGHVQSIVSTSAGWPWLAAQGRGVMDGTPSRVWREGIPTVAIGPVAFKLPLRPIWPGLLANTLFYAALTLSLMAGWRWLRTRRRRVRGRCVACGYELGEGVRVCPECGLDAVPNA
ncbi:MAG: hypothetical protein NCW75_09415 [Phycisphaera sp.]|nr:MAG: hypothetical protein NCW75_09415 [Phycisphaera sp.]